MNLRMLIIQISHNTQKREFLKNNQINRKEQKDKPSHAKRK